MGPLCLKYIQEIGSYHLRQAKYSHLAEVFGNFLSLVIFNKQIIKIGHELTSGYFV
jgi:hypothetical protein